MHEPRTYPQAIKPFLTIHCLCGLGIFESCRIRAKNLLHLFEYAYAGCVFLSLNLCNWYSVRFVDTLLAASLYKFSPSISAAKMYFNGALVSVLIIASRISAKRMKAIIEPMDNCDRTMDGIGISKQYRKLFFQQTVYLLAFLSCNAVIFFTIYEWTFLPSTPVSVKLMLSIVYQLPFFLLNLCTLSFCFWVNYSRMKFKQLNKFLREMSIHSKPISLKRKRVLAMKDNSDGKRFQSPADQNLLGTNDAKTMRAVKRLHLESIKIARSVNAIYGVQNLLIMITFFGFITGTVCILYKLLWIDLDAANFVHEVTSNILWLVAFSCNIFYPNHVCAQTSMEAANTGDIVCELHDLSTSKEFQAEVKSFTLQLMQNPLIFTACGFFEMNYTFVQGVIGSITTYFVILVQVNDTTAEYTAKMAKNHTRISTPKTDEY